MLQLERAHWLELGFNAHRCRRSHRCYNNCLVMKGEKLLVKNKNQITSYARHFLPTIFYPLAICVWRVLMYRKQACWILGGGMAITLVGVFLTFNSDSVGLVWADCKLVEK